MSPLKLTECESSQKKKTQAQTNINFQNVVYLGENFFFKLNGCEFMYNTDDMTIMCVKSLVISLPFVCECNSVSE